MWRTMSKLLISKLWLLLSLLVLAACNVAVPTTSDELLSSEGVNPQGYVFNPIRVGAGGFITGLAISADGSLVIARADTYGLYRLNKANNTWTQQVTDKSLPASDVKPNQGIGVYELAIAPSNSNRVYMAWNNLIYRSDNKGSSWSRTTAPLVVRDANAQEFSKDGPLMAVDPRNPDVVIVGAQDVSPAYISSSAGSNWSVSTLPKGQKGFYIDENGVRQIKPGRGITAILFDKSSPALSNGRTSVVYASSYLNGVYRSSNGGQNWSRTSGGPNFLRRADIASDGALYGVDDSDVWRYRAGAWKKITVPGNCCLVSVVVDPKNPARLVGINGAGTVWQSSNRGDSWSTGLSYTITSPEIPWLARNSSREYFSPGSLKFDPVTANKLWVADGAGVYYATLTPTSSTIAWQSINKGIEQLVGNDVIAPPGGKPVVAAWDFGTFYIDNPDVYRSRQAVSDRFNSTWNLDYVTTNPKLMVGNTTDHRFCCPGDGLQIQAGYSLDGGQNWTRFPKIPVANNDPVQFGFGDIAVSANNLDNIVWMPSFNNDPYYTLNRGQTWNKVILPGLIQNGKTGSHFANFLSRKVLVSDKTTSGTFYLAHSGQDIDPDADNGIEQLGGVFRTTDGGKTWLKVYTNLAPFTDGGIVAFSNFNATLKSVPGKAGHLFFSAGPLDGEPDSNIFKRSSTGGTSWQTVPNVTQVHAFGFGKTAPGKTYPTIFIAGKVRGEWGLWRSVDDTANWRKIGAFPNGSLDRISAMDGDKDKFGWLYMAFGGSGFGYGYSANGQ
jgi:photosystem II stability/assembly factor-like uncharacterized protein